MEEPYFKGGLMKFKVGDRVRAKEDTGTRIKKGMTGTIVDDDSLGIQFDEYIAGHSCGGIGEDGYCWYCCEKEIEKISEVEQVKEKKQVNEENMDSGKDHDKGEIMEILRIYKGRKLRDVDDLETKSIDDLLDNNKDYVAYVKAETSLGMEKDRGAILEKLLDNDADFKKKYDDIIAVSTKSKGVLADYIAEVEAQLDICETYDQKIAVLKTYGIIGDDGKINA